MNINPLNSLPCAANLVPPAAGSNTQDFQALLQKLAPVQEDAARRKEADEAAAGLVSTALILPILKQVRRSPFNTDGPFSAGKAEKTFGPEFDMQIADRIAQSPRLGIKKALSDRLMKRGPQKTATVNKGIDLHG